MIEISQTEVFSKWLFGLRDRSAKARILVRIDRLRLGLTGDIKPVGEGVSELRVDYGPGYRIYVTWRRRDLAVLLVGGDKRSQPKDIRRAQALARNLED